MSWASTNKICCPVACEGGSMVLVWTRLLCNSKPMDVNYLQAVIKLNIVEKK